MGIFSDSPQADIQAISHIVGASLAVFARENEKRAGAVDYEVSANDRFEFISDAGGRILQNRGFDNAVIRVATLVVLCNAAPPFSVKRHGKLCLDFAARKDFLSRFTCLLVHAALSTMEVDRGAETFVLRWNGFPDDTFSEEFLTYLQWIDSKR